jgi:hypothetical protein
MRKAEVPQPYSADEGPKNLYYWIDDYRVKNSAGEPPSKGFFAINLHCQEFSSDGFAGIKAKEIRRRLIGWTRAVRDLTEPALAYLCTYTTSVESGMLFGWLSYRPSSLKALLGDMDVTEDPSRVDQADEDWEVKKIRNARKPLPGSTKAQAVRLVEFVAGGREWFKSCKADGKYVEVELTE